MKGEVCRVSRLNRSGSFRSSLAAAHRHGFFGVYALVFFVFNLILAKGDFAFTRIAQRVHSFGQFLKQITFHHVARETQP